MGKKEPKTVHVIVTGRVQGVFFREFTRRKALELQLNGWVRNLRDGSVEAILSGTSQGVDAMLAWLKSGSPMAEVKGITTTPARDEGLEGFTITG